ncbi:CoA transferase [Paraburkholderia phenazinium]|uniref:CoA transferase n=1 Tax=Paraburkholderia phenazinium TaxID=60549 RepID=UPI001ABA0900|nr:CoA transferase [Paraburkholderia phenazinium]
MLERWKRVLLQEHLAQQSFEPPVGPAGDLRLLSPHNKPVKTSDGWIAFTINTDQQVRAFLNAVGRADLIGDPRFATVGARAKNVKEWFEIRGAPLTGKTTIEWLDILQRADIAVKPCLRLRRCRMTLTWRQSACSSMRSIPRKARQSQSGPR